MTEEQIEELVERQFGRLEARLASGHITQDEYEVEADLVLHWANNQYLSRIRTGE